MRSNEQKLNAWFDRFAHKLENGVPEVVAETAVEYFKESFVRKSWDNSPWAETAKPVKRGSLMVRSSQLLNSIRPAIISAPVVRISAGNSKVPYAKVHNEGGLINRAPRSETFTRNRFNRGTKKSRFKKGTNAGQGFSFKAYSYNMPKRQFMGHSAIMNKRIIIRLKQLFNNR